MTTEVSILYTFALSEKFCVKFQHRASYINDYTAPWGVWRSVPEHGDIRGNRKRFAVGYMLEDCYDFKRVTLWSGPEKS